MAKQQTQVRQLSTDPETGIPLPLGTAEALLGQGTLTAPKFDESLKDSTFSILFVANVLIIIALAFSAGITALKFNGVSTTIVDINNAKTVVKGNALESGKILGGLFFILISGSLLSMGWIYLLSRMALKLVNITFTVILFVATVSGFSLILSGSYTYGFCLLLLAVSAIFSFIFLQPRLAFATSNLKIACEAIKAMPSTILAAAGTIYLFICICIHMCVCVCVRVCLCVRERERDREKREREEKSNRIAKVKIKVNFVCVCVCEREREGKTNRIAKVKLQVKKCMESTYCLHSLFAMDCVCSSAK